MFTVHWAGGNPFHHHQQLNRLVEGWQKPDTVIVQDIWWTAAAKMADIVLPVTSSLERNDIGGSSRDRYVLAMHQAIAPQHQARNDFDIFADLAERTAIANALPKTATSGPDRRDLSAMRRGAAACRRRPPEFEDFGAGAMSSCPRRPRSSSFDAFRADPQANPLQTPSGKIELFSERIAGYRYEDFAPHPQWRPPVEWLGAPQTETGRCI